MMDKSKVAIPEKFKDHPAFNTLHCGMNFGFMAKRGYYSRQESLAQPAKMAAAGVNWSTLNASFCQEKYSSTKVFLDFDFSSSEIELTEMVKAMHDNGIHVLLKPCLTSLDGAWMGAITFPQSGQIAGITNTYQKDWFKSFSECSKYFAEFAEKNGVDALIIGAEYYGTEGCSADWANVIKSVRDNYSGPLTYEFTHASRKAYSLDWFDGLDFLSYSYYPPACNKNAEPPVARDNPHYTIKDMVNYLKPRKEKITSICERFGNKPIAFTEIGVRSAHGCIMHPANFMSDTYYDGEEQANYMDALYQTFWDLPQWLGMYWWKWDETQNRPHYHTDPNGDMGFTIDGKPAEKVMLKWFAKNK